MEIVAEGHDWLNFRPCQRFLDFLTDNGIRSTEYGPQAWSTANVITVRKDTPIERWMCAYGIGHYPRYGSFSYSYSAFGIGLEIGRYCSVSWNVRIMGPHHAYQWVTSSEVMYRPDSALRAAFDHYGVEWKARDNPQKPLPVIGNDVWVGQDVLLARGIRLGDGCVVAAGAVVTKDVPPYAVVGGVPARVVKWRFPMHVIVDLQRLRWWDYALPEFSHLSLENPETFVGEFAELLAGNQVERMKPIGLADDVIRSFI